MFKNFMAREVNMNVAFLGPSQSGKKTVMGRYHHFAEPRGKVQWGEGAHAAIHRGVVFFDFVPPTPVMVQHWPVRFHFYTVVEAANAEPFAYSLEKADAIVFVADSQRSRQAANVAAMEAATRVPSPSMVLLHNKRDLTDVATIDEMNLALNRRNLPFFETIATGGSGVEEGVKAATADALRRYRESLRSSSES